MADTSFIEMTVIGDKSKTSPKNENSTWNGTLLQIGKPEVIAKIVNVEVVKNQSTKLYNKTSLFSKTNLWSFNGTSVTLVNFHYYIKVTYEKPEQTVAEFEATQPKEIVQLRQQLLANVSPPMLGAAVSLNAQDTMLDASTFNLSGISSGGFIGKVTGSKPAFGGFVKRSRLAQMAPGAGDGSGDKTSSKTSELTTLFKKTLSSSGNQNILNFTQGSVAATIDALKKHTATPAKTIESEAVAQLPPEVGEKLIEQALIGISDKENGVSIESKMTKEVKTEVKAKLKEANNAGAFLDPDSPTAGLGRSGANVFARAIAAARGSSKDISGQIKVPKVPFLPEGVIPPQVTNAFGKAGIPNLIEGINPLTKKLDLSTNTSKLVDKGKLTPTMIHTNIVNLGISKSAWQGYFTPKTYKFEFVDTADELESEFENSSRFKTGVNNKVIAIVIGWTDKIWGPPEKVNASSIHEISKESDLKNLVTREGSVPKAIAKIRSKQKLYGIQAHYLILTDGRIQRGRPVDEVRNSDTAVFDLTGVQITLVANTENPVNPEQLLSLNKLISKVYKVLPGANLFGDYEIDQSKTGPAVDIASLRDKYGKANTIEDPANAGNGPTRKEIAYVKPKDLAQGIKTMTAFFDFNKTKKTVDATDLATGAKLPPNTAADLAEAKAALNNTNINKIDFEKAITQAVNDPKNSAAKQQGDSILKALGPIMGKDKISTDSIVKKLPIGSIKELFGGK
jgi:hypothetical protein